MVLVQECRSPLGWIGMLRSHDICVDGEILRESSFIHALALSLPCTRCSRVWALIPCASIVIKLCYSLANVTAIMPCSNFAGKCAFRGFAEMSVDVLELTIFNV